VLVITKELFKLESRIITEYFSFLKLPPCWAPASLKLISSVLNVCVHVRAWGVYVLVCD
jgi:hypothetical protein